MEETTFLIFIQLFLATILGALIGIERGYKEKPAGMKTHALVCMGAAMFIALNRYTLQGFPLEEISLDPSRVLASIVVGVGFIGGGLIIKRKFEVEGLTTAAGLWVSAAVGAGIGMGIYLPSIFATFLTLFVFHGFTSFENKFIRRRSDHEAPQR